MRAGFRRAPLSGQRAQREPVRSFPGALGFAIADCDRCLCLCLCLLATATTAERGWPNPRETLAAAAAVPAVLLQRRRRRLLYTVDVGTPSYASPRSTNGDFSRREEVRRRVYIPRKEAVLPSAVVAAGQRGRTLSQRRRQSSA
jgi:hypothetical protein